MPYLTLALFLLAVGLLWSAVLIYFMARNLLTPRRMTDVRALARVNRMTPADLGLPFTPMGFTVRDVRTGRPLRMAAWWVPAPATSDKTVVLVHGYGDAKVGAIAWAPTWRSLGWHVLAVDLRAHGESDGVYSTAGFYEREDLDQILNALRAEKPQATNTLALFGISLGAACVAATVARRGDVAAVVLESPFADYRDAVHLHVKRNGFPFVRFTHGVCRVAEWISRCDFRPVAPAVTIPTVPAPLLTICGTADPFIDPAALARAMAKRPTTTVSRQDDWPGVSHVMALAHDPAAYRDRLATFLNTALAPSPGTPGEG
ncbi:MAG TPA: alpha/beta fold hydrolase [Tepidisphaeraceae bacterium]|jgi:alpha-beta hydrolase superfamily lysophospholipase